MICGGIGEICSSVTTEQLWPGSVFRDLRTRPLEGLRSWPLQDTPVHFLPSRMTITKVRPDLQWHTSPSLQLALERSHHGTLYLYHLGNILMHALYGEPRLSDLLPSTFIWKFCSSNIFTTHPHSDFGFLIEPPPRRSHGKITKFSIIYEFIKMYRKKKEHKRHLESELEETLHP